MEVSPPHSHNLSRPVFLEEEEEEEEEEEQQQQRPIEEQIEREREKREREERRRMSIEEEGIITTRETGGERGERGGLIEEEGERGGEREREREREEGGGEEFGREKYRCKMSHGRMVLMSGYWFARAVYSSALLIIVFPQIVENTFPFQLKNRALGLIGMFAAVVMIVVAPVCGLISDKWRTRNKYGRRLPFVMITTFFHLITLTILGILGGLLVNHEEGEREIATEQGEKDVEVDAETAILFSLLVLFWTIDSACDAAAISPYSALIPELVSLDQVGAASGWMGFATMIGNVIGVLFAGATFETIPILFIFWILALFFVGGTISTVMSNDPKQNEKLNVFLAQKQPSPRRGDRTCLQRLKELLHAFSEPFRKSKNFIWVFLSRFLMMMSFAIMTTFLQFFLLDVVGQPSDPNIQYEECSAIRANLCGPDGECETLIFSITDNWKIDTVTSATSIAAAFVLLGSLFSALASGILSDYYGRKVIIYISGGIQGFVVLAMLFVWQYNLLLLLLLLFGFGYGAFISVDWALASDALPPTGNYAKDMGVWSISLTLPTVFGPPVAGVLIDILNILGRHVGIVCLGYRVVFVMCAVLYGISTYLIRNVSSPPRMENISLEDPKLIEMQDIPSSSPSLSPA